MKELYFDNAATTKPNQEVLDTFNKINQVYYANASSNHKLGFECDSLLHKCREQVGKYLNVKGDEIYFTSGATEANNLAILGVARHNKSWANKVITSSGEHPSVLNVFKQLENEGFNVVYIGYDKEGNLDFDKFAKELDNKTSLVSIMNVNNEIGFIFPIDKIYKLVKEKSKAVFHTDATQAIGKIDIDSKYYDLLTFSSHKIEGLKGSGVLIKKKHVVLDNVIFGGGQENGLRPGTTPLPLIASTATALRLAYKNKDTYIHNLEILINYLRDELSKIDEVVIVTPNYASKFIFSFGLTRHKASVISEALSTKRIYVGTKSACSEKVKGYSVVALNAGYDQNLSENIIRLSFNGNETLDDGKEFIKVLNETLKEIKEVN